MQLGKEQGKASVYRKHIKVAEGMHQNFYENREDWDDIEDARKDADQFIAILLPEGPHPCPRKVHHCLGLRSATPRPVTGG